MDIYQKHTGRVLGPLGSTIKEIQARFGVKMNIHVSDSAKSGDETALNKLRVTGSFDGVRGAKQFVCHILNGGVMDRYPGMSNGPPIYNQSMGGGGGMQMNNHNNHSHSQQPQYGSYGKNPPLNSRSPGLNSAYYPSQNSNNSNSNFVPPRNKFTHNK